VIRCGHLLEFDWRGGGGGGGGKAGRTQVNDVGCF